MKTELLIAGRNSDRIWELSNCTTQVTYSTARTGSPGTLKFQVVKSGDLSFTEGDTVRFSVDGTLIFLGWVFSKSKDRWGVIDVICYDRLRYLKTSASYSFYDMKAGDIIRQIAGDFQLETGVISDTGFAIPSLIEEEQTCLDIIGEAVQQTLLNTGKIFVFYDDGNGLALQEAADMISNVVIGERSLLTEYTYKTDIDEQTYNSVKLARPNEVTGMADVFVAQHGENIAQWGLLQLYQTVDGAVNDAQVRAQAEASLSYYNRKMRTLKISSLGVVGLRAGQMVFMRIPDLGDISLNQYVLLEKVEHTFTNDTHTMDIETLTI